MSHQRIALIIGNTHYADQALARLKQTEPDLAGLAAALRDPAIGNFRRVDMLLSEPASEVRRRIEGLFRRKKRHDVVLLYLAGLTIRDQAGELYLAAADTRCDTVARTAIPAAAISGWMDQCFSRQQILILDCSHSAFPAPGVTPGASVGAGMVFKGTGYGRVVLARTDRVQVVFNGSQNIPGQEPGGEFSRSLVQGLRTGAADLDEDGQVDVGELHQYLCDQFLKAPGETPRPGKWSYYEQDKFIIARNPARLPQERAVKWDLIFGAVMAPVTTIAIGGRADLSASVGLAGLFLLLYAFLYWMLD